MNQIHKEQFQATLTGVRERAAEKSKIYRLKNKNI